MYKDLQARCPSLCATMLTAVKPSLRATAAPRIVAAASILLQTRNKRCNTFQKLISLLLWKGQCKSLMFRRLKLFGVCTSRATTLRALDSMTGSYDKSLKTWQEAVSKQEDGMPQTTSFLSATPITPCLPLELVTKESARTSRNKHTDQMQRDLLTKQNSELHPGYQIVFDNVNLYQKRRHKTTANKNQQVNLVQLYAVQDRVNLEDLPDDEPILPDITSLHQDTWWLPMKEQATLKAELEIIVGRIATKYLPCLKPLQEMSMQHIPHAYSSQTVLKSKVNKLGLLEKDEMFTSDMVDIMSTMQQYCPRTASGRLVKIPFGGDGMSVEKSYIAKKARMESFHPEDKLAGLIPKPEDWHEGVIILQDIFNAFYSSRSTREKGTMYNLREVFDRRGVKSSAKDAVNDNREFLTFITHGFVVLAAMQVLGLDEFEGVPVGIPTQQNTIVERQNYLHQLTSSVVDRFVFPYGVLPSDGVSYQLSAEDFKCNYICALMREGLLDIARLDAVKEGDGERIVRHWRYDFVHLHVYNHPKYRLLSFRMIAQIFALLTPRMAARLMHNRTVNVHGGIGHNISLDIFLEFMNKDVKADLKRSGPNLTSKLLERIGRSKQVMDELLHAFDREVELFTGIGRHPLPDWSGEVSEMVVDLKDEHFFQIHPGREFPSFPKFQLSKIHKMDLEKLKAWVAVHLTYLRMEEPLS